KYRLERLLARTNLSEVYVAKDGTGRRVCVKRLLPSLATAGSTVALSFRREATLLADVHHANVVRVLEVGEDEGVPFTCLELIEGQNLAEFLADGPPPPLDALSILQQMALGLSRVHGKGIVHGDLKPANVLVHRGASRDAGVEVKLADFGLA